MPESARITLSGSLPGVDELNGLPSAAPAVIADNDHKVVAVVVLGAQFIKHNVDTDEGSPQMRVWRIEPVTRADDLKALGRIADRAHEARTGKSVLPLDMEDEVRAVFGHVNTDTGEITDGDA